ncbi:RagB/SusD family nutrient uptake outer membrane protein [Chryseobacterium gotjawalense]|uniref:RagB/SusD family nutrient uptake outer membrane protein n=1 Tax=Chryseobacterium gotjawalense TaxID=3042315 RepID=A0ABY8R9H6_9FLAO|nr:RagB/SusD family nutrient uptake outer membrane protein [Chryseobacterium sp. wdc7]WHF50491.1 RagB/SusD family nutrient uptake outer membrane protein [Chryseobacterium sp. wdc7]
MKKLSILLFACSLFLTSCNRALEAESVASLDANSTLSTEDVDKLLTGAYKRIMEPSGYPYFSIMATEVMADNYKPVKFQFIQLQYLFEHVVPPGDILLSYYYKDFYTAISRANTIIKVPSSSASQIGKAKYVRALSYLRLYDLYEGVPIVDENTAPGPIAVSSGADVLDFIIADLKAAKGSIEPFNASNASLVQLTPTKEAAQALLARVLRIKGDINAAGVEAEELIKSGKFSIANNPKENASEVILKFAGNKAEENGSWGWIMSYDASTWNCFAASDDLLALLGANDTRKTMFDIAEAPSTGGFVFSNKYSPNDDSDLLISRIPEMYLISAEAGNKNRLAELQNVRKSNLSLDNERRVELSFEWVRWQDLKLKGEKYKLPFPQGAMDANDLLH